MLAEIFEIQEKQMTQMTQLTLRYDRPVWEGLKQTFQQMLAGKRPCGHVWKILLGIAHRRRKTLLQLARTLDSLTAANCTKKASAEEIKSVRSLLRKLSGMLDAYEQAFGQDQVWEEVINYSLTEAQVWLSQAEHYAEDRVNWPLMADEWKRMEQSAFAQIEKESGEVSDFAREYVRNRLERYFDDDCDPTDILCELDALDDTVRPWELADYQLFGVEPPPHLQTK